RAAAREPPRTAPRRGGRRWTSDSGRVARRHPRLLPRPVAEEAASQAPPAEATPRARARVAAGARRLPARRDGLAALRGGDTRDARGGAAARQHIGRICASPGVAPADEVRAPRP